MLRAIRDDQHQMLTRMGLLEREILSLGARMDNFEAHLSTRMDSFEANVRGDLRLLRDDIRSRGEGIAAQWGEHDKTRVALDAALARIAELERMQGPA
ncbi:hypothetical protein [Paraburkholderia youngii]|uniref:hypothetical protein n=1 Tax=Paraburkholderia youngii TaxID=2782701 RepID=UPI0015912854|nr:hypothetical protein [Paraburkholderia youngii]NUX58682.1 hypothetical protein [Paraburkholderia youngii]